MLVCLGRVGIIGNTGVGCSVDQTNEGGFIVFGWGIDWIKQSSPHQQHLKFDTFGNEEWLQSYGTTAPTSFIYGQQTGDGGYISLNGSRLLKTDENGNEEWNKIIEGWEIFPTNPLDVAYMRAKGVRQTTDGGYVLLIQEYSNNWKDYVSFSLVKTDLNGKPSIF